MSLIWSARMNGRAPRIFDPRGLPQPDGASEDHPRVQELRELAQWSEGMVWWPACADR